MRRKGLGRGLVFLLALTLLITNYELRITNSYAEEESYTITTYYPSPYGSYNELSTNKFAVGDADGDGKVTDADQPNLTGDIRLKPQAGNPASWSRGKEGEIAYSGSKDTLYVHNGSSWVAQAGGAPVVATFYGIADCPSVGGTWTKLYDGYITTFAVSTGGGNSLCVAGPLKTTQRSSGQVWNQGDAAPASAISAYSGTTPVPCCACIRTE